jgi:hypothetical protein
VFFVLDRLAMGKSIYDMPVELMEAVAKDLPLADFQFMRLACKHTYLTSLNHYRKTFFKTVTITLDPDGLSKLQQISQNEHIRRYVRTLVFKFNDAAMACVPTTSEILPVSRALFQQRHYTTGLIECPEPYPGHLLKSGLFETQYFQRTVRNHSSGDLIWSPKEYKLGERLTENMTHRLEEWISMVQSADWGHILYNPIARLPALTSVALSDGRKDEPESGLRVCHGNIHPYKILAEILGTCFQSIHELYLDFDLKKVYGGIYREALPNRCHWETIASRLRKLSVQVGQLDALSINRQYFRAGEAAIFCMPNLEQLHLYSKGKFNFMFLDHTSAPPGWILRAYSFPKLRTLSLEYLNITPDFAMSIERHPTLETLVLHKCSMWDGLRARRFIYMFRGLARIEQLKEVWIDTLLSNDFCALFLLPSRVVDDENVEGSLTLSEDSQLGLFASKMDRWNYGDLHPANSELEVQSRLLRKVEVNIIRSLTESGKKLMWGKPAGIGRAWDDCPDGRQEEEDLSGFLSLNPVLKNYLEWRSASVS